jgi:hypothetical protein
LSGQVHQGKAAPVASGRREGDLNVHRQQINVWRQPYKADVPYHPCVTTAMKLCTVMADILCVESFQRNVQSQGYSRVLAGDDGGRADEDNQNAQRHDCGGVYHGVLRRKCARCRDAGTVTLALEIQIVGCRPGLSAFVPTVCWRLCDQRADADGGSSCPRIRLPSEYANACLGQGLWPTSFTRAACVRHQPRY